MRLGLHYGSSTVFPAIIDDVVEYESAGADVVWLGESYGFDAVSALGALSTRTSTIHLGTAIMAVQTRSPALIAMTMAGVDALSGGRAILGLGASGPQVIEGLHDVTFGAPLSRTRTTIEACRSLWRGDRLTPARVQSNVMPYKALKLINRPHRADIPIYIAAIGPRNVSLAAEVADGWMPAFFWPDRHHQVWGDALAQGQKLRSPDLKPLEVSVTAPLAIGEMAETARARHREVLAHYLGAMGTADTNFYLQLASRYGLEKEVERVHLLYQDDRKAEAALAVPEELVEGTSVIGDTSHVQNRLHEYAKAQVTVLNLTPTGHDRAERAEQLRIVKLLMNRL